MATGPCGLCPGHFYGVVLNVRYTDQLVSRAIARVVCIYVSAQILTPVFMDNAVIYMNSTHRDLHQECLSEV